MTINPLSNLPFPGSSVDSVHTSKNWLLGGPGLNPLRGGKQDRDETSWDITLQWEGDGIRICEISDRPSLETTSLKKIQTKPLSNLQIHDFFLLWRNPSCTGASAEVFLTCFEEALKIYAPVYAVSILEGFFFRTMVQATKKQWHLTVQYLFVLVPARDMLFLLWTNGPTHVKRIWTTPFTHENYFCLFALCSFVRAWLLSFSSFFCLLTLSFPSLPPCLKREKKALRRREDEAAHAAGTQEASGHRGGRTHGRPT